MDDALKRRNGNDTKRNLLLYTFGLSTQPLTPIAEKSEFS